VRRDGCSRQAASPREWPLQQQREQGRLARQEMKVMFRELFRHLPDIEMSGEPDHLSSSFINGIKHMPATFAARTVN
jgi:hypothetical protein